MKSKLLIILTTFSFFACNKYLDMEQQSTLSSDNFYKTEQDAFDASMAMYSNIQHLRYYGSDYFKITEYPSDDITSKLAVEALDQFSWSATTGAAGTQSFADFFLHLYEGIYRTNIVLEKVSKNRKDKAPDITFIKEIDRNNILAEAHFLRGLHYFNGACIFGGMSILTSIPETFDKNSNIYAARSTRLQTFEQAIKDLEQAIGEGSDPAIKLPESWVETQKGRATIYAGWALLGKIYLHAASYYQSAVYFQKASDYLKKVIDSGKFQLLPSYRDVFSATNKNNAEGVFEIGYGFIGTNGFFHDGGIAGENTQRDLLFGPQKGALGFGELIATQSWVLESEYGDPRVREFLYFTFDTLTARAAEGSPGISVYTKDQASTVKEIGINNPGSYFHVKKAVDGFQAGGAGGLTGLNNWRLIRYADVLLMYAEAQNELGNSNEALVYVNKIRKRAYNSVPKVGGVPVFRSAQIIRTNRGNASIRDYAGLYPETTIGGIADNDTRVADNVSTLKDFPGTYTTYGFTPVVIVSNKESVREAIVRERRTELAFEYIRFLDMRRWEALDKEHFGAAEKVFKSKEINISKLADGDDNKPYNPSVHNLYPIPQVWIDISQGTLTQNPNY